MAFVPRASSSDRVPTFRQFRKSAHHPRRRLSNFFRTEDRRTGHDHIDATCHDLIEILFGHSSVDLDAHIEPMPTIVQATVDALNRRFSSPEERWEAQYYPVSTSSTEVIVDAVGCIGICVETWMGFEEGHRIEMQKAVVEFLLDHIGVRRLA